MKNSNTIVMLIVVIAIAIFVIVLIASFGIHNNMTPIEHAAKLILEMRIAIAT